MPSVLIGVSKFTVKPLRERLKEEFSLIKQTDQGSYAFLEIEPSGGLTHLIARIILDELQNTWIRRMIHTHYGYFDKEEQDQILSHVSTDLKRNAHSYYPYICRALDEHLAMCDLLVIEGFVRFRIKDYWLFLRTTLDKAVDAFLIDQEYQEFIKLLRYFVELQEPKIYLVNIVLEDSGGFKLIDAKGEIIKTQYLEGIILEIGNNELDYEDLLISALITVAPNQIVLHAHKNNHVSKTIMSIFDNRVSLCSGCSICYNNDEEPYHNRRS